MSGDYIPRYRWRETWPGEGHQDYEASDGGTSFGRISLDTVTLKKGQWRWAITFIPWVLIHSGYVHNGWAPTAREASRLVEELYDRLKEMHGR
jgi:hypothetical protein